VEIGTEEADPAHSEALQSLALLLERAEDEVSGQVHDLRPSVGLHRSPVGALGGPRLDKPASDGGPTARPNRLWRTEGGELCSAVMAESTGARMPWRPARLAEEPERNLEPAPRWARPTIRDMKTLFLATHRPYNWRVFWWLVALIVLATFALIPFAMSFQSSFDLGTGEGAPRLALVVADRIVAVALNTVLAGIGLALAHRIGLGLPFLESWARRVAPPRRFRAIVAVGGLVGIGSAVLILALDFGAFMRPTLSLCRELGIDPPKAAVAPPLYGFLAAISAGVTEETAFRLFGLSLLAWLGGLLHHGADGRPRLVVFWTANFLMALAFGAAHLPTASAIGLPMNALVLSRTFLLNGLGGLAFGWLFWTYGLESAILAHVSSDVVLYALLPLILLQEGETARIVAGAAVALALILGVIWAATTLARATQSAPS